MQTKTCESKFPLNDDNDDGDFRCEGVEAKIYLLWPRLPVSTKGRRLFASTYLVLSVHSVPNQRAHPPCHQPAMTTVKPRNWTGSPAAAAVGHVRLQKCKRYLTKWLVLPVRSLRLLPLPIGVAFCWEDVRLSTSSSVVLTEWFSRFNEF